MTSLFSVCCAFILPCHAVWNAWRHSGRTFRPTAVVPTFRFEGSNRGETPASAHHRSGDRWPIMPSQKRKKKTLKQHKALLLMFKFQCHLRKYLRPIIEQYSSVPFICIKTSQSNNVLPSQQENSAEITLQHGVTLQQQRNQLAEPYHGTGD